MEIRKIKPNHCELVYNISSTQFKDESWTQDQFLQSISDDNYICAGLFDNGELFSYVIAIQSLDDINILSIATKEEYKHNGYATRLIKWYKNLAQVVEKTLSLEVKSKNTNAINLYQNLGFKKVHERKNYYKDGDTALIMFCDL